MSQPENAQVREARERAACSAALACEARERVLSTVNSVVAHAHAVEAVVYGVADTADGSNAVEAVLDLLETATCEAQDATNEWQVSQSLAREDGHRARQAERQAATVRVVQRGVGVTIVREWTPFYADSTFLAAFRRQLLDHIEQQRTSQILHGTVESTQIANGGSKAWSFGGTLLTEDGQ